MKQLLQTCHRHVVVGLNDRAYVVVSNEADKPTVYELLAPVSNDHQKQDQQQQSDNSNASPNEIQAVAITMCDDTVWCCVSRRNKTLSLYSLVSGTNGNQGRTLDPCMTHKTPKRVCCLAFAQVPAGASGYCLNVVVAGDLVGDATAYPTELLNKSDTSSGNNMKENGDSVSRLLLGHTASVLTGVKVVQDVDSRQRILTSDRDEKVRVTRFPQTHVIEGYLLGHDAFIAAMDVATDPDCFHCVTCSGDGTIRLWNYKTYRQISQAAIPASETNHEKDEKQAKDGKTDGANEPAPLVPIAISMSPNGSHVAVLFDKCQSLYTYAVSNGELEHFQTIECNTIPLAVCFSNHETLHVVVQEPDYLQLYQLTTALDKFELVANDNTCKALQTTATADKISMPATLLEVDKSGKARLKLKEHDDRSVQKPWNNVERIQIAKERNARRHKRRREAMLEEGGDTD